MRDLTTAIWQGTLTAASPIAHGSGRKNGTTGDFRRETIFVNGQRYDAIPVISGGTIRHSLRAIGAHITQQWLSDTGKLPVEVAHALHNGGALRSTGADDVLTGERQAVLRDLVPHMSVFGGVGGARAISGILDVDGATPFTQETAPLASAYGIDPQNAPAVSVYELIHKSRFGRFANMDSRLIDGDNYEVENGGMIFWSQETLPAGTQLLHMLQLNNATPIELDFFHEVLRVWRRVARVGQQRRMGMGRLTPDYSVEYLDLSATPVIPVITSWRDALEGRQEEACEALKWL